MAEHMHSIAGNPTEAAHPDWRSRLIVAYGRGPHHKGKGLGERLLKRLLGVGDVAAESPNGVRYALNIADLVQGAIFYEGSYEPKSLALVRRLLRPGDTMIDVGGHVGQYALHAAQVVGRAGRVVVFEPNPRTHQYLLRNIALNGFDFITPVLGAVDQEIAIARMSFGDDHNWGGSRRSEDAASAAYYSVTAPLKLTLPMLSVRRIDVLKIDVEGLEGRVLASLDYAGPLRPRNIVLEYLPQLITAQGYSSDVLEGLRARGYALTDVHGNALQEGVEPDEFNVWARDTRV